MASLDNKTHDIDLALMSMPPTPKEDQPTIYLAWAPIKLGELWIDNVPLNSISGCVVDYFAAKMKCSLQAIRASNAEKGPQNKALLQIVFDYTTRNLLAKSTSPLGPSISCEQLVLAGGGTR